MGRIIKGQVLATTGLDADRESLSERELTELFVQMSDEFPSTVSHDLSQSPVVRAFNKRLERLPNGDLAIKVDLEVFDEQAFARYGGMSIGFYRRHVRFGAGDPVVSVTINSRQFDFDEAVKDASSSIRMRPMEVVERVEKAFGLETAIITILVTAAAIGGIAVREIFSGFFNSMGADLY